MSKWEREKRLLWETAQEMLRQGLVSGSSGNASLRLPVSGGDYLVAITPSRRPYRELSPEDMVIIDQEGEPVEGDAVPSSESLMHLAIYKARRDVGAILHTHSIYASVLAVARLELPPIIDEMVMAVGGGVKVAEYAFPGTEELARHACAALGEQNAVLLRNHGTVGVGRTLLEALDICALVERAAQIFVYASLLGKVNPLPKQVVEAETELFRMARQVQEKEMSS